MVQLFLLLAACLVPFLLVWYICVKNRYKNNPQKEIWKAFGYGVLVAAVAIFAELFMGVLGLYTPSPSSHGSAIWTAFFGAALPEEVLKLLFLYLFIKKCKCFEENIDGIVYAVALGMGFAATENAVYFYGYYDKMHSIIFYRSILSVPCHYICAVLMGYYYSLVHFKGRSKDRYLMFLLPVLFHGVYDSFMFMMNISYEKAVLLIIIVLAFMVYFVVCTQKAISKHLQLDLEEYILSITPPDIICDGENENNKKEDQ